MKINFLTLLTGFIIVNTSCINAQTGDNKLTATDFAEKIKQTPSAFVIDVRTPEEFAKGHLLNAKNFNWNGENFQKQVSPLDKTMPVFVYCLSGGRSSAAATKMREDGFTNVYELKGGIMKWRAANLPETTGDATFAPGMSRQQFDALLVPDKIVLIDFYADWCAPCKLMKPYLEEIAADMKDKVQVIRINADDNQPLLRELKIDELPVLQVYKNKSLGWTNTGFISKEDVLKHLK
jgi:thioredoxin